MSKGCATCKERTTTTIKVRGNWGRVPYCPLLSRVIRPGVNLLRGCPLANQAETEADKVQP